LTQALSIELKETNISLTSVHPNGISSERAMQNIKNSSFIARLASLTPNQVAKISLDNMFSENVFVIPGVVNKLYYSIGCSLPHGLILKIIGNIFQKTS
jgi:short-subunit dehydrogenase